MNTQHFNYLLQLALARQDWQEHASIEDLEKSIENKQTVYCKIGYHIRSRIDLYNYCQHISDSGPEQSAIIYLPLNIADATQHKYCLLFLSYLQESGFNVCLPYKSNAQIQVNELITSTLDTVIKMCLRTKHINAKSISRYVYSAGKSKASFTEISREYNYGKIYFGRECEAKGISGLNRNVSPLYPSKYLLTNALKEQLKDRFTHDHTIGWFPSIKECAVINKSTLQVLSKLSRDSNIIIGIHPILRERDPEKYVIINDFNHTDFGILYTELIDSSLLAACCDLLIGDVGTTIWDGIDFSVPLILLRNGSSLDYDDLLLKNKCFYEWYIGNEKGRYAEDELLEEITTRLNILRIQK